MRPSSTLISYTATTLATIGRNQPAIYRTQSITRYTSATLPPVRIPAALSAYPVAAHRAPCSDAVPTPSIVTVTRTAFSGVATDFAQATSVVHLNAQINVPVTRTAYQTVVRAQQKGLILLAGDSSVEDRAKQNGGSSTGWGSYASGFSLLSSQHIVNFGASGATTQSAPARAVF